MAELFTKKKKYNQDVRGVAKGEREEEMTSRVVFSSSTRPKKISHSLKWQKIWPT